MINFQTRSTKRWLLFYFFLNIIWKNRALLHSKTHWFYQIVIDNGFMSWDVPMLQVFTFLRVRSTTWILFVTTLYDIQYQLREHVYMYPAQSHVSSWQVHISVYQCYSEKGKIPSSINNMQLKIQWKRKKSNFILQINVLFW